jgi:hypothetical protein
MTKNVLNPLAAALARAGVSKDFGQHPPIVAHDLREIVLLRAIQELGSIRDLTSGRGDFCRFAELKVDDDSMNIHRFALTLFTRNELTVLVVERTGQYGIERDVHVHQPVRQSSIRIAILEAEARKMGILTDNVSEHSKLRTQWGRVEETLTSPVSSLTHEELVATVVAEIQSAKPKEAKHRSRE